MKQLHIVNGEGTAVNFRLSGLDGDIMIWNEALAMGPILNDFASSAFWKTRSSYFQTQQAKLTPSDRHSSYHDLVISEFDKYGSLNQYQNITLWFEHDLFCQINLMAALSWLHGLEDRPQITLVCIDNFEGMGNFRGLGQLAPTDFMSLYTQAITLTQDDLNFAHSAWAWYSGKTPHIPSASAPETFPYWAEARIKHLSRFPSTYNGLSALQQHILELLSSKNRSKHSLLFELLTTMDTWGFGDLQYLVILDSMQLVLDMGTVLKPNRRGDMLLAGQTDFMKLQQDFHYLGAVRNRAYRWTGRTLIPHND